MDNNKKTLISQIETSWQSERWNGIHRPYTAEDVYKLRGSFIIEHTLARKGAVKLWDTLPRVPHIKALGAVTGHHAVQMVQAGLKAIYCSGWQVAGDNNEARETYPDQSLYPANSVPNLVRRYNNALIRKDQIQHLTGKGNIDWMVPIIADAEAGFGSVPHVFEIMKDMIEAGASGVHFEDQLATEKKCGHLGGKVVVPTSEFVKKLVAARLAADVLGVPTIIIARTDADSAKLLANDIDERDRPFIEGERSKAGFFRFKGGLEAAIARALVYAPYADLLWCETSNPNLDDAQRFAEAVHAKFPGKLLAYNCSPSFNWKKYLDDETIALFQNRLGEMGYKFQFVTLAGFHVLNFSMFTLAKDYAQNGMSAYVKLQQAEFASEAEGYRATKHQEEVGTGYFDQVQMTVTGEDTETIALKNSTEKDQF